MAGATCVD